MMQEIPFKLRAQITHFLALADPRCDSESHGRIIHGEACRACHRDLAAYFDVVPAEWPT